MTRVRLLPIMLTAALAACADLAPTAPVAEGPSARYLVDGGAGCELAIPVADALTEAASLRDEIAALQEGGALNAGQARALRTHVANAERHLAAGRICPAIASLEALQEQVEEFVSEGVLTAGEAAALLDAVAVIAGSGESLDLSVTITSPAPYSIVASTGSITYTVGSDAETVVCKLDGADVPCSLNAYEYAGLGAAMYHFSVQAFGGGVAGPYTDLTFMVDGFAPFFSQLSAFVLGPGAVRFVYRIEDISAIATVYCRLDGGPFAPCGGADIGQVDYTGLAAGEHLLEVYAVDQWGNSGQTAASAPVPATFARVSVTIP